MVVPAVLDGQSVRLEPLREDHLPALAKVAFDSSIWRWTIAQYMSSEEDLRLWIEQALEQAAIGKALPWVTWSKADQCIVGSTRYMDIDARHYTLEIGWTWVAPPYQRSGLNVEAKYLQFQHAFEVMGARRVSLKTHHENFKSQRAIEALGATKEGVFRNHMIMPDDSSRHSVWYSVIREEWPVVKAKLEARMEKYREQGASARQ